jgi:hypothetical protein
MVNDSHRLGLHSATGAVIMEVAGQDARVDIFNSFAKLCTQKTRRELVTVVKRFNFSLYQRLEAMRN